VCVPIVAGAFRAAAFTVARVRIRPPSVSKQQGWRASNDELLTASGSEYYPTGLLATDVRRLKLWCHARATSVSQSSNRASRATVKIEPPHSALHLRAAALEPPKDKHMLRTGFNECLDKWAQRSTTAWPCTTHTAHACVVEPVGRACSTPKTVFFRIACPGGHAQLRQRKVL
jgi:hypothetical protein